MRLKLILIAFGFISTSTMVFSQVPPGVNADRYNLCMNEGLGKGRPYSSPEEFCAQWASNSQPSISPTQRMIPPTPVSAQCYPLYPDFFNCQQIGARAIGPGIEFCKKASEVWVTSGCAAEVSKWKEEQAQYCPFFGSMVGPFEFEWCQQQKWYER